MLSKVKISIFNGKQSFEQNIKHFKKVTTVSRLTKQADPNAVSSHPNGTPRYMQVVPTELMIKPGDKLNFRVRLFDEFGNFIREEKSAEWSLDKLKGTVANGQF